MASAYTTVKVSRGAKELLERLRSMAAVELGVEPRLQDVIEAAARLALRRREEFLEELGAWTPVEDPEKLLERLSVDLGVRNSHAEVDEVVYGWRRPGRHNGDSSGVE